MKRFPFFTLLAVGVALLVQCKSSSQPGTESGADSTGAQTVETLENYDFARLNYAIGASTGNFMKEQDVELQKSDFMKGVRDGHSGNATMTEEEIQMEIQRYFQLHRQTKAAAELQRSERFLDSVRVLEGVVQDSTGLLYRILEQGSGKHPSDTSFVEINYSASFASGEVFDSNEGQDPVVLSLRSVIRGWTIGIPKLKEGARAELFIPSDLAYGERGRDIVPGNAVLKFDVELVHVLTPNEVKAYRSGEYKKKK